MILQMHNQRHLVGKSDLNKTIFLEQFKKKKLVYIKKKKAI